MSEWGERARALKGEIEAARAAMDAARRLPDELAAAFARAGLYKLCVPNAFGGGEVAPQELAETLEALAEVDASAAWCVMIGATTGALAAYLDADVAQEIFGPADAIVTGAYAPMGRAVRDVDTYRVSGQWKWNSGGQNSTWLLGGCLLMENGAPQKGADGVPLMRMMLTPARNVSFIDTWHTGGLWGTGSGDMAMKDVAIPVAHTVSLTDDKRRVASPLYAFPVFGLLALGIAAVASGNAKGALAEFAAVASGKRMPNGRTLAERGVTQAMYAQAYADYSAARAFLLSEIESAWNEAQQGAAISMAQRARLRLAATHLVRTSADVVRQVQDFAGGASVFLSDPLHRRVRDAQTATAHIMIAPPTYELTGRVLLGGEATTAEL